jgi:hypothetical protein
MMNLDTLAKALFGEYKTALGENVEYKAIQRLDPLASYTPIPPAVSALFAGDPLYHVQEINSKLHILWLHQAWQQSVTHRLELIAQRQIRVEEDDKKDEAKQRLRRIAGKIHKYFPETTPRYEQALALVSLLDGLGVLKTTLTQMECEYSHNTGSNIPEKLDDQPVVGTAPALV